MSYLLLFLIILISLWLPVSLAEGGTNIIEFKKAHVTNSPKVCGDKLCDEVSKEESSYSIPKNSHTPMGKYNMGIPIHKIICQPNSIFVLKLSNWHPACVKPDSVQRLVDIGWAASLEDLENIFAASAKKEIPQFAPLKEYRKEYPLYEGLGMSIESDTIYDEEYLIFNGYGWHGFHNVEITISNKSGEVQFMMTQTNPDGILYLHWKIPDTITSGWYQVYATDGIHEYEIDIPIFLQ
ncbi:MAG: hypothetical protein IH843_02725 [Thaumarchaeota archaeon]|nr:hypothetical protein [Nitrososphaerota archaeon]